MQKLTADGKKRHTAAESAAPPTLMTLQEVADYSARDPFEAIHRMLKRNQIPAFRIGRHWRFNLEVINKWCASRALSKEPEGDV